LKRPRLGRFAMLDSAPVESSLMFDMSMPNMAGGAGVIAFQSRYH
jgi:hypothetical protein